MIIISIQDNNIKIDEFIDNLNEFLRAIDRISQKPNFSETIREKSKIKLKCDELANFRDKNISEFVQAIGSLINDMDEAVSLPEFNDFFNNILEILKSFTIDLEVLDKMKKWLKENDKIRLNKNDIIDKISLTMKTTDFDIDEPLININLKQVLKDIIENHFKKMYNQINENAIDEMTGFKIFLNLIKDIISFCKKIQNKLNNANNTFESLIELKELYLLKMIQEIKQKSNSYEELRNFYKKQIEFYEYWEKNNESISNFMNEENSINKIIKNIYIAESNRAENLDEFCNTQKEWINNRILLQTKISNIIG